MNKEETGGGEGSRSGGFGWVVEKRSRDMFF